MEWQKDGYLISDDMEKINLDRVKELLDQTYWANDRTVEIIAKTLERSFCLGLYKGDEMLGFARVVTDETVFTWLCDIVIDEPCRGQGLGDWFVQCLVEHPRIKGTRMHLATRVNSLYEKYGFERFEAMRKFPSGN